MAAGRQVWFVLALISIVGVDLCRALADPQHVVYNRNGVPGVEGTWRWQTPEGSSVRIQYPVNNQGFVPWTPARFSYSISSDPASPGSSFDERIHSNFLDLSQAKIPLPTFPSSPGTNFNEQIHSNFLDATQARRPSPTFRSSRKLNIQIPNNNPESSIFLVNKQDNHHNENKIQDETIKISPALFSEPTPEQAVDKFQISVTNTFPRPQRVQIPLPEIDPFQQPIMDQFSGPVTEKIPDPVVDDIRRPIKVTTESQTEFEKVNSRPDISPTIPPLRLSLKNKININSNDLNNVNRDEQVEDSTVFEPVVRLTSRGRPQRRRLTTRKPSIPQKKVNRPVPRLPQAESNRQRSIRLTSRGRPQLVR